MGYQKELKMADYINLEELLKNKRIIIPYFQRGYAQGRDNPRDESVRSMFVSSITDFLFDSEEKYSLDYVYGRFDEDVFYPVDGQQRLTTLLIFYLYCEETRNIIDSQKCVKFRYEWNDIANEVLDYLVNPDNYPRKDFSFDKRFSAISNLLRKAGNDLTANGLIRVYKLIENTIQERLNKAACSGKAAYKPEKLNKVVFKLIDMRDSDLPDSTFWKMNSRGKQLTESEVFKAGIIGQIDEKEAFVSAFSHFYEAVFFDIRRNEDIPNDSIVQTVDNVIMRVVKSYCRWLTKDDDYKFNDFILPEKYWEALGKDEAYKNLQKFFVFYTNGEAFKKFLPERKKNLQEKKHLFETLNEKLIASAITFFGNEADDRSFSSWMRISANLIDNSCSDKNLKKIINLLSEHSSDIESYLSSKNVSYFLDKLEVEEKNHINTLEQLEEEIKKIKLIESDSNWRSAIERAENKEILNGKVSILWCDGGDKDIERFNANLSSLIELWEKQNTEKREYTFSKTLLSYYKSNLPEMRIDMKCSKPSEAKDVIYNSLNGCFEEFIKSNTEGMASEILYENKYWIKCICDTDILKYNRDTGRYISTYWGKYAILWGTNGCTWNSYGNILFSKRYEMLATLIDRNLVNLLNDNQRVGNTACFNDGSVYFEYSGHIFQFWWAPGPNEHDIYLMKGDRNKVDGYMVRPGRDEKENVNDYEKYYCLSFEADDIDKEVDNVLKGMIRLIDIAS